jgi:hypothetical protein
MLALIVTAMELARFYAAALVGHYLGAVRPTLKSTIGTSEEGFEEKYKGYCGSVATCFYLS